MKREEREQLIKETVAHAKDSWGNEDSRMAGYILSKIEPTIRDSIEKHVNGKIVSLSTDLKEYIKRDEEWKKEISNSIRLNTEYRLTTMGGVSTFKWILGIALGGGLAGIGALLKVIIAL